MFSNASSRTILVVVLTATVLVPAAQADSWARDGRALDPALATAIADRAPVSASTAGLDPALATAIRARATASPATGIDPAIHTALLAREVSATRPDDRAAARGVGSLPQTRHVAASEVVDWGSIGISAGVVAALLLGLASIVAVRRRQEGLKSA